jgi:hypothetical protein
MACFPQKARKDSMSELAKQSLENLNIISGIVCYKTKQAPFASHMSFPVGPTGPTKIG